MPSVIKSFLFSFRRVYGFLSSFLTTGMRYLLNQEVWLSQKCLPVFPWPLCLFHLPISPVFLSHLSLCQICPALHHAALVHVNSMLETIPVKTEVDRFIGIDYSLIDDPVVTPRGLDMHFRVCLWHVLYLIISHSGLRVTMSMFVSAGNVFWPVWSEWHVDKLRCRPRYQRAWKDGVSCSVWVFLWQWNVFLLQSRNLPHEHRQWEGHNHHSPLTHWLQKPQQSSETTTTPQNHHWLPVPLKLTKTSRPKITPEH